MVHRFRRRRWLVPALLGGALLLVAAAAWFDLSKARAELNAARVTLVALADDPASLRTGPGRDAAQGEVSESQDRISAARRRLQRSLPLRVLGALPGVSTQRQGALAVVDDARAGAGVGMRLLPAVQELAAREQLKQGQVPLAGLRRMREHLVRAGADLAALSEPADGLWGPLARARRDLNGTATRTSKRLREAAEGMGAAETFLGAAGPRRYLLAVQNNAEMRDQGMVLSYAFVRVEGGRLSVERAGSIADLTLKRPVALPVPPGMATVFGGLEPNKEWRSVNATADFAWSGRAMAEMAQLATGQAVDGVIAIDVPGLAAVLRVVGPVTVEGVPEPIDADNAADVLLNRLYLDYPTGADQTARKEKLGALAEALVARMASSSFDAVQLGSELGTAAATGHLRLWSAHPEEEASFERSGLGGGPGLRSPQRTIHLSVQNATATKLDYFVKPRVNMRVSLTPQGAAVVETEVVVVNTAPRDAPESYQFGGAGLPNQTRAGQYVARVYFWGPRGAQQSESVPESGLRLNQVPTRVDPGERQSVRFLTVIPDAVRNGRLDLRLVPQPRLEPMKLRVTLAAPGWDVDGPLGHTPVWDRPVTVSWKVER